MTKSTIAFFVSCLLMVPITVFGQQTVSGKVTSADEGTAIPGVNIIVQGTSTGTTTNVNGNYSIDIPEDANVLVFSAVGYTTEQIEVGDRTTINVAMAPSVEELSEVVVTAFGLEREEKSLSYSVQSIDTESLSEVNTLNVANQLSGKVAGVNVQQASSGPGGSSRVVIRGNSSLSGNNQPLYVVDGMPIDNTNTGAAGRWGGIDRGDGISNLNADDFKSISVLKGPNAAALYGQRGANGVVVIETKNGQGQDGLTVSLNSNATIGEPWVLPDYQNQYGIGTNGQHRYYRDPNTQEVYSRTEAIDQYGSLDNLVPQISTINNGVEGPISYGPELDGHEVYPWYYTGQENGKGQVNTTLPFSPQPNNVRDWFDMQQTFSNTLGFSGGFGETNFYFSLHNTSHSGMLPTNNMSRNSFNLRLGHDVTDNFRVEGKANYITQKSEVRPDLSDSQQNVMYLFRYMPRNLRLSSLDRYEFSALDVAPDSKLRGPHGPTPGQLQEGYTRHWSNGTFTEQPNWAINNVRNEDSRDRLIGFLRMNYDFTDWLSMTGSVGNDYYTERQFQREAIGTRVNPEGGVSENIIRQRELNSKFLVTAKDDITDNWYLEVNAGMQRQDFFYGVTGINGSRLNVRGLYTVGNAKDQGTNESLTESRINSAYAFGQVAYKNMIFLDWTARNDWASTLNPDNSSFFYPSVSASAMLTDIVPSLRSDVLSALKVRGSWAQAGSSGDPYQIFGTYSLASNTYVGRTFADYQDELPYKNLKNELTTSVEGGVNIRLFEGRGNIDFTYYDASTTNQIIPIGVAPSSGYTTRLTNAGEIVNSGIELMLSGRPIEMDNGFEWDVTFNYAKNNSEVVELVEGVERYQLGVNRNVGIFAEPGQPYGQIYANKLRYMRDDQGRKMIDDEGLPILEEGSFAVGNAVPDWLGGFQNTFAYKGLSLSALLDIRQGGEIFSMSNVYEVMHGTTKRTLEGREGGLVVDGVKAEQNGDGEWVATEQQNDIEVTAQEHVNRIVGQQTNAVTEEFLNDASYVALRSVRLGYTFPDQWLENSPFKSIKLSLSGRNLAYLERHTDGFSPEAASYNVGTSSLGIESQSFPKARTYQINLNAKF